MVFAVNPLFYLNQCIPIYGVFRLHRDKDVTTDILIKQLEGVKLRLEPEALEAWMLNETFRANLRMALSGGGQSWTMSCVLRT